jgi:apolipoprotein D and lipocalin family protein
MMCCVLPRPRMGRTPGTREWPGPPAGARGAVIAQVWPPGSTTASKWCKRRLMRFAALMLIVLASLQPALALTPVANFDLARYPGTWYEIAAIPGFLQSRCARDTHVTYTSAENGALAAQTNCTRADGTADSAESRTRPLDPAVPAVLKVTAVNFLGIWWYPLGRESIVIAVEPGYRWLVVGHPSLRYGRILSREPSLAESDLKTAAGALTEQQFDLCKFVTTAQTKGRVQPVRLCDIVK